MKNKKKMLILMSACLLLASCRNVKKQEDNNITDVYPENDGAYASYSLGDIYIGSKDYLDGLTDLNEHDILVEDQRTNKNPNMRIYDSYNINDMSIRREILEAICNYEKENPSAWERTIPSMEIEWYFHNVSYYFSIETKRAKDVDLDNDAEDKYGNAVLKKIIN